MRKMILRRLVVASSATGVLSLGLLTGATVSGSALAHADAPGGHTVASTCGSAYYENSDGICIPRPDGSPTGIRCKDGTYSHATTRQGACSHHGGIADSTGDDNTGGGDSGSATGSAAFGSAALGGLAVGSAVLGAAGLLGSS